MERILAPIGVLCVVATVVLGIWGWTDTDASRIEADRGEKARRLDELCGELAGTLQLSRYQYERLDALAGAPEVIGQESVNLAFDLAFQVQRMRSVASRLDGTARQDAQHLARALAAVNDDFVRSGRGAGTGPDWGPLLAPEVRQAFERLYTLGLERCPNEMGSFGLGPSLGPSVTTAPGTVVTPPVIPPMTTTTTTTTTRPGG